jgi:hypothetical protein
MKFATITFLFACAFLIQESSAWFGGFGFGFRRFGFGFGPFFPFGAIGPFGPFGPFGFGPFGPLGFRFGRSVDNVVDNQENFTIPACIISTARSSLACVAPQFHFECLVATNMGGLNISHDAENLRIVPKVSLMNDTLEENILKYDLVSLQSNKIDFNEFTFKHNETSFLLSLYNSESIKDLGFRVESILCWNYFLDYVKVYKTEKINFSLSLFDQI